MNEPPPSPLAGNMPDGIEVVELAEVDLDFAVEEMFRQGAPGALETTQIDPSTPDELAGLDLFHGIAREELAKFAPQCQSIRAVPGYVLLAPGRLNTKVYVVIEGQLRVYLPTGDKRPVAIADVGHTVGLRSALTGQPTNQSVISTEISHVVAIDVATIDELNKRLNGFARNYATLLATYVRGDHCLQIGAQAPGRAAKPGYIDELTLLHNQHWLDTMLPRLIARHRMGEKPLAVMAFAVDKLPDIVKEHGIGPGLRVLEAVGHWTLNQTRPTDILAIDKNRFIYAFLPDCDLNAAVQLAGRLKQEIQTLSIALPAKSNPPPITVTLSLAAATLEPGMKEADFLGKTETLIRKSIKLGGNWLSDSL